MPVRMPSLSLSYKFLFSNRREENWVIKIQAHVLEISRSLRNFSKCLTMQLATKSLLSETFPFSPFRVPYITLASEPNCELKAHLPQLSSIRWKCVALSAM